MAKSKRTKATDISQKTKQAVWKRDNERCIICGSNQAMPNAHYIPRSKGGLGIEQNIVTLCNDCHRKFDNPSPKESEESIAIGNYVKSYLDLHYPDLKDSDRIYRR